MPTNVVSAPDSLQPATMDFSALMAKAMEHPAGNDAAPATPVAEPVQSPTIQPVISADPNLTTPPPEPVVAKEQAPPLSPAEAKILDLPDDGMVRAKVDGKEELLSIKEFRDSLSREAVFTKRMQSLAELRKQAEAELAAQYAAIQTQAQALEIAKQQIFARQTPAQVPAQAVPTQDPGELATIGEVQSTLQAYEARLAEQYKAREQQFVAALGQASQQVQEQVALQRDAQAYNAGLNGVLTKPEFAVLKQALPYAEESIRYQVAAMDPQSIDEAIQFTERVATEWSANLRKSLADVQQRQEVAKAQAKLEPPTGSAPPPVAAYKPGSAFGKDGKFNWDALHERAKGMLG